MPNHPFPTVEQMLDELESLASSSSEVDEEYTEEESSSSSSASSCLWQSSTTSETDSKQDVPGLQPSADDGNSSSRWNNEQESADEEESSSAILVSAILRQYCCSCDILRSVWRRMLSTQQQDESQQEPLLADTQPEEEERRIALDSSSNNDFCTTRPHAPKRSLSAEERVLALIHQNQSATLGQGPKPWDTLQDILKKKNTQSQSMSCSSEELPADYWARWNTDGYSLELTKAVRKGDLHFVQSYTGNLQCSNAYGESILHVAARRGDLALLQYMHHERGVSFHVSCESARNLLHDACWTSRPSFACITWLLEQVPELLLVQDARGRTPLEYAPADTWDAWNAYLVQHQSLLWLSAERVENLRTVSGSSS